MYQPPYRTAASLVQPRQPTIFVSIASYCDPECAPTIRRLFGSAEHPERVFVGVCWQSADTDDAPGERTIDRPCWTGLLPATGESSPRRRQYRE